MSADWWHIDMRDIVTAIGAQTILQVLRVRGAWLGAALWALHPVMVQSVAWVTELKNTQSCVFYLLSILFFLKWEDQGGAVSRPPQRRTEDRRSLVFALSLLFFILATLSKPSVVMLPFVLALCVWWMRGKIRWRDALALAPFALISVVASAWTIWEQRFHARAVGPDWEQTFPERLIIAGKAIWFYIGKLVWPHPLIFIYPRWDVDSSKVVAYLPLLAAIAGLVALWFIHAKWGRVLFFASAYYVVSLFPVLGFFSVFFFRYSFVSDHFQYLASMGPLALAGAGIATLLGRFCETPADFVSHPDAVPRSGSTIASPRWRLVLSGGSLRNPSGIARLFDVAANRGISQSIRLIHSDVTKKSGLLDGALQSRHRSQRAGRSGSGDRSLPASRCPAA